MEIGCPLVEILVASSLPPGGELQSPRGELHFSTGSRCYNRASCVFLFPRGLVRTFLSSSARRFHRFLDCSPWANLLVVPTLQSDFVADVTIVLRGSRKLVVTFCLLRLRALYFYDLHRSPSLLSFADVTVGLLLYLILR